MSEQAATAAVVDAPPEEAPSPPEAGPRKAPVEVGERGVQLRSLAELYRFAQMVFDGGAAPRGMDTVGKVAVAIQTGMEAGLTPMHALQAIVVINGVTSWRGQSAVGLIRSHKSCLYIKHWTEGKGDEMKGVCISRRRNAEREERSEFTVDDAKTAELWKKRGRSGEPTPWVTYPGRQLMWRAVGFHCKDLWSDVLGGFPIDEEVRDYADELPASPPLRSLPPPSQPDPLLQSLLQRRAAPEPVSVTGEVAIHGPGAAGIAKASVAPAADSHVSELAQQSDVEIPDDAATASSVLPRTPDKQPSGPATGVPGEEPGQAGGHGIDCTHPKVPPSRLKPGKTIVCPDCQDELTAEPAQKGLLG